MQEVTVREAAQILEVTTQTIYRRLREADPKQKHQKTINGIKYITVEGMALIDRRKTTEGKESSEGDKSLDDVTERLIATLQEQLKEKDKQIAELTKIASAQATLLAQRQQLELITAEAGTGKKGNIFQRLKARFSNDNNNAG